MEQQKYLKDTNSQIRAGLACDRMCLAFASQLQYEQILVMLKHPAQITSGQMFKYLSAPPHSAQHINFYFASLYFVNTAIHLRPSLCFCCCCCCRQLQVVSCKLSACWLPQQQQQQKISYCTRDTSSPRKRRQCNKQKQQSGQGKS